MSQHRHMTTVSLMHGTAWDNMVRYGSVTTDRKVWTSDNAAELPPTDLTVRSSRVGSAADRENSSSTRFHPPWRWLVEISGLVYGPDAERVTQTGGTTSHGPAGQTLHSASSRAGIPR